MPLVVEFLEVRETAYYAAPHVAYRITAPTGGRAPDVLDRSQAKLLRDWLNDWLRSHPAPDA